MIKELEEIRHFCRNSDKEDIYMRIYTDEQEIEKLNYIINGVEDLLKRFKGSYREIPIQIVLNEIRELKGEE